MSQPFDNPLEIAIICGVFGLLIGSFLNVVIYRLPVTMKRGWARDASEFLGDEEIHDALNLSLEQREQLKSASSSTLLVVEALPRLTLAKPRSTCPKCGHRITALENIPILSYLVLRGKCSACKTPISMRYPIIELVVGLLFAAAGWHFGLQMQTVDGCILAAFLVALTMIDADTMLLPDSLTLPLLWLGILASLIGVGFVPLEDSVMGAAGGYCVFWLLAAGFRLLRGIEGMGGGDFKLLAAMGAWFGWEALLPIILLSAGVGSVVGVTLLATRRATLLSRLPFGVYLAPAGLIMLFFGQKLIALVMPVPNKPYVVAVTGGIGSGKSTVADGFAAKGIVLVDADLIARALTVAGGEAMAAIVAAFGQEMLDADGALDRARMRKAAFADDGVRGRLEAILHPMIRQQTRAAIEAAHSAYVMWVVPLLFESGGDGHQHAQRVLVVDCPQDQQIERVMSRSALSRSEVEAIMARQCTREQRLRHADDVIDNRGNREDLDLPIAALHHHYLELAQEFREQRL